MIDDVRHDVAIQIDTAGLPNPTAQTDLYSQEGRTAETAFNSDYEMQGNARITSARTGSSSGILCGQEQLWVSPKTLYGRCHRGLFHYASKRRLSGLERAVASAINQRNDKVYLSIYADDFIITGYSKEVLETKVKPVVEAFLHERGLELSQEKTKITHIDDGFDFLGVNVSEIRRQMHHQAFEKERQKLLSEHPRNHQIKSNSQNGKPNPFVES